MRLNRALADVQPLGVDTSASVQDSRDFESGPPVGRTTTRHSVPGALASSARIVRYPKYFCRSRAASGSGRALNRASSELSFMSAVLTKSASGLREMRVRYSCVSTPLDFGQKDDRFDDVWWHTQLPQLGSGGAGVLPAVVQPAGNRGVVAEVRWRHGGRAGRRTREVARVGTASLVDLPGMQLGRDPLGVPDGEGSRRAHARDRACRQECPHVWQVTVGSASDTMQPPMNTSPRSAASKRSSPGRPYTIGAAVPEQTGHLTTARSVRRGVTACRGEGQGATCSSWSAVRWRGAGQRGWAGTLSAVSITLLADLCGE